MPSPCPPENGVGVVDPCATPGWDELIGHLPGVSFFHGRPWAEVLSRSYGYRPCYLLMSSGDTPCGLLPLMEVKSALTGKRGVALPFSDKAPVLASDERSFERLFRRAVALGREHGWRGIELRGAPLPPEAPSVARFFEHELPLGRGENALFRGLHPATRRNVVKAQKENLETVFASGSEAIKAFYRLHCKTRRGHGLPPQPFRFFQIIHNRVIAPGQGVVAATLHNGIPVASAVFLFFRSQVLYKFGASEPNALSLRPNNLLFWEAIRRFRNQGFQTLHFGRTDLENEGLARFKRGWGAEERLLLYHRFDLGASSFVNGGKGPGTSYRLFRLLPVPVLRLIGACLYRHLG